MLRGCIARGTCPGLPGTCGGAIAYVLGVEVQLIDVRRRRRGRGGGAAVPIDAVDYIVYFEFQAVEDRDFGALDVALATFIVTGG